MANHSLSEAVDCTLRLRDGRQLGYAEFGAPNGHPVFYFHGFPGSRLAAALHAKHAADAGVRLIATDRPGMGLSDFQPRRRLTDWPNDVVEMADALKIEEFSVLGFSGGGPYAAVCAREIPQRLTACGIVSGIAPIDYGTEGMKPTSQTIFLVARRLPWLLRGLLWMGAGRFARNEEAIRAQLRASLSELPEQDRTLMQDPLVEAAVIKQAMEAYRQGSKGPAHEAKLIARDWGFRPGDIAYDNVHLWHGGLDVNVPAATARRLAKSIRSCKATFYADEAHLSIALNHAAEIMAALSV